MSRRTQAARAAYLAGALMVASGTVGSTALYQLGYEVLSAWFPRLHVWLVAALVAVSLLAGLGGLTVVAGGWAVANRRPILGKVLITIGVGTGILGLGLHLALVLFEGGDPVRALVGFGSTVSGVAVLLSIYARWRVP